MTYMTRDQNERAKINIIRMAMSPIGNILVNSSLHKNSGHDAGRRHGFSEELDHPDGDLCSRAAALMLFCFATVRERVVVKDEMGGEQIPLKKGPACSV